MQLIQKYKIQKYKIQEIKKQKIKKDTKCPRGGVMCLSKKKAIDTNIGQVYDQTPSFTEF